MQEAAKIQEQMDGMVQHQESKAGAATEQLKFVVANKQKAQEELAKFQVLREGLKAGAAFLTQQRTAMQGQENVNPMTMIGFEGALVHLTGLMEQAGAGAAKNEGSFVAFSTMETQLVETIQQATARSRGLEVQSSKAVAVAAQGEIVSESVADLIDAAAESAPAPITTPKKKAASTSKRGKGRKTKR